MRRLVKRRQAICTASPFTAAIVAVAESWLYKGGVLCYIQDRTLRVLDLHQSGSTETVVDVRSLLREAVGETRNRRRYKLQLLHYADGLVTCLYSRARESWLLVFDVPGRRLLSVSPALESSYKVFVRNDANFLYYGTHSEFGEDGYRRWVLMSYNIRNDEWLDQKVHLMDMVGCDIGQSICFEIIDGYFYGLSNQTSFEVDEVDWTSYYHCFCFPVGNPRPQETRRSIRENMWRRQHAEGPLDDRWSFIRLLKNEETGELQILESRKEWLAGSSSSQRTYYTTDLSLGSKMKDDCAKESQTEATNATATFAPPSTFTANNSSYGNTSTTHPDSASLASAPRVRTDFTLPTKITTRPRNPYKTHIGDDALTALLFTFSKCPVRSYHAASQTFLDLVDDPSATTAPQLKLRAGARHAVPASSLPPRSPAFDTSLPHTERIPLLYKDSGANEILFWPPTPEGVDSGALELLGRVVSPPSHVGNVHGTWDERSFVYSTGSDANGLQAVVFLGFDPAIKLQGVQKWGEHESSRHGAAREEQEGEEKEEEEAEASTLSNVQQEETPMQGKVCEEPFRNAEEAAHNIKGKEVAVMYEADDFAATWATEEAPSPQTIMGYSSGEDDLGIDARWVCSSPDMLHMQQPHDSAEGELQWAWELPAMYQEICFGFNGLPDFTQQRNIYATTD